VREHSCASVAFSEVPFLQLSRNIKEVRCIIVDNKWDALLVQAKIRAENCNFGVRRTEWVVTGTSWTWIGEDF
jgi:hypothetical protein